MYDPAVAFAVNTADVAKPDAFVTDVFAPPAKLPLAPLAGAVNVTFTPLTGLPAESLTVAESLAAKAVLIAADCGVPLAATMDAAVPPVFVRLKLAGVWTPATEAVTT